MTRYNGTNRFRVDFADVFSECLQEGDNQGQDKRSVHPRRSILIHEVRDVQDQPTSGSILFMEDCHPSFSMRVDQSTSGSSRSMVCSTISSSHSMNCSSGFSNPSSNLCTSRSTCPPPSAQRRRGQKSAVLLPSAHGSASSLGHGPMSPWAQNRRQGGGFGIQVGKRGERTG
jgi:hypothetical protein